MSFTHCRLPSGRGPPLDARLQHVAAAAHGVQEARLARIGLDLAAQPGDLDVDGALAGVVHAERGGDVLAREHLVGLAGERGQQGGLAAGQADRAVGAAQFAALGVEGPAGRAAAGRRRRRWRAAARRSRARMRSTSSRGSNGLPR